MKLSRREAMLAGIGTLLGGKLVAKGKPDGVRGWSAKLTKDGIGPIYETWVIPADAFQFYHGGNRTGPTNWAVVDTARAMVSERKNDP